MPPLTLYPTDPWSTTPGASAPPPAPPGASAKSAEEAIREVASWLPRLRSDAAGARLAAEELLVSAFGPGGVQSGGQQGRQKAGLCERARCEGVVCGWLYLWVWCGCMCVYVYEHVSVLREWSDTAGARLAAEELLVSAFGLVVLRVGGSKGGRRPGCANARGVCERVIMCVRVCVCVRVCACVCVDWCGCMCMSM